MLLLYLVPGNYGLHWHAGSVHIFKEDKTCISLIHVYCTTNLVPCPVSSLRSMDSYFRYCHFWPFFCVSSFPDHPIALAGGECGMRGGRRLESTSSIAGMDAATHDLAHLLWSSPSRPAGFYYLFTYCLLLWFENTIYCLVECCDARFVLIYEYWINNSVFY
jgi:hypothetical protein